MLQQQQQLHHLHKILTYPKPNITIHKKLHFQTKKTLTLSTTKPSNFLHIKKSSLCNAIAYKNNDNVDINVVVDNENENENENSMKKKKKSFWGAVSLIIGAAVGPGMLGLPSLTIKSGPIPSTIIILISWLYVISSIILVAELCFDAMKQDNVEEVSFTNLATRTLGQKFGSFVAFVYTSLCFSLLVACVAGIGSIISPIFPKLNNLLIHSLFPIFVGTLIVFFPFNTIDFANRVLCFLMFVSISGLVGIGIVVARANIISSFGSISWKFSSILPIIPVAVLTLGFHVITPFICKIAGNTIDEARKAILIGGTVPLVMVLSWNLIVLGLVGSNKGAKFVGDPITLLLSVNPSALSAVQGFAFSAMATSLIGYAVSLPKQILDTIELVYGKGESNVYGNGRVGSVFYSGGGGGGDGVGYSGKVGFGSSRDLSEMRLNEKRFDGIKVVVTLLVLCFSVLIASYFRSTFSRALDFAGVYANCFLFGIIPPVMTYIHQQSKKEKIRYD
jgi:tyrosine-specific transport protein